MTNSENQNHENGEQKSENTWTENVDVTVDRLLDEVKKLVNESNVRRLIIRKENGNVLLEIPLVAGIAVGGMMTIALPMLTAIGAITALVAKVRIEIVRSGESNDDGDTPVEHIDVMRE